MRAAVLGLAVSGCALFPAPAPPIAHVPSRLEYLAFREAHAGLHEPNYLPFMLHRFPRDDIDGAPLVNEFANFCFPDGLALRVGRAGKPPPPRVLDFELCGVTGGVSYVCCLRFWEQVSARELWPMLAPPGSGQGPAWAAPEAIFAALTLPHPDGDDNGHGGNAGSAILNGVNSKFQGGREKGLRALHRNRQRRQQELQTNRPKDEAVIAQARLDVSVRSCVLVQVFFFT